jgi:hypothetical protein
LQLVMSPGSNILFILIRCSLAPEKASCQESGGMFPDNKLCLPFAYHLLPICFPSRRLLVLKLLPNGTKFNQNYFIDAIFPGLYNEKPRISRKDGFPAFSVHMDNSMCHNGNKISEKLAKRTIEWAPHPLYSPDISPCDFWLFGMREHKMKDWEFQSQQTILSAVANMWNDLTFADVQGVFQECMERLTWVIGNNGEYSPN